MRVKYLHSDVDTLERIEMRVGPHQRNLLAPQAGHAHRLVRRDPLREQLFVSGRDADDRRLRQARADR